MVPGKPSPRPTRLPTVKPIIRTPSPTPNPPCDHDGDFRQAAKIVVSNGCDITPQECDAAKRFLRIIVEKSYNDEFTDMGFYAHGIDIVPGVDFVENESRDDLLEIIDNLPCGANPSFTEFGPELRKALDNLVDVRNNGYDDLKLIMINFCGYSNGDNEDVCDVVNENVFYNDIRRFVINAGTPSSNMFDCVSNEGDVHYVSEIDDSSLGDNDDLTNGIKDKICDDPPTPQPTSFVSFHFFFCFILC